MAEASAGHVGVEVGEGDKADVEEGAVVAFDGKKFAFGGLFFEFYFVADDVDDFDAGSAGIGFGDDVEDDGGVFFAADEADGAVKGPVEDVDGGLGALADGDDFVALLEASVAVGGSAGDEAFDDGGAVFGAEHGADADEGEFHVDFEVFEVVGGHEVGVGVEGAGEGGEEAFGDPGFVVVADHVVVALVLAADEGFGGKAFVDELGVGAAVVFGDGFEGGFFFAADFGFDDADEELVFDLAAPEVVPGLLVGGPLGLFAFPKVGFVEVVVHGLGEEGFDEGDAVDDALLEGVVDVEGEVEVSAFDGFFKAVEALAEGVDVGLEEEAAFEVEGLDVVVEGDFGDAGIPRGFVEVHEGEAAGEESGGPAEGVEGGGFSGIGAPGPREGDGEEEKGKDEFGAALNHDDEPFHGWLGMGPVKGYPR